MRYDPFHLLAIGIIARPVFIDRSNEALLLTLQRVPYGIAGGWRTGIVVIAPGKIGRSLHVAGKVDHIIISHSIEAILVLEYLMILAEMGVTARSALLHIARHVAEGRMIGHTLGNSLIESCRDESQSATLTATLHSHILAIPLWERSQEVDAAHQSQIYMLHIVAILILQSIGEITAIGIIESLAYLIECTGRKTRIQAMNLYLEADESVLGIILVAQGFLDGLDAGSRRGENHGMAARSEERR